MLIQVANDVRAYMYDVFVARFDFWLAFGILAQVLFGGRFLVQWIASERAGRSVMPLAFSFFSIAGGVLTFIYGFARHDAVIMIGQVLSLFVYSRNLMLIFRERRDAAAPETA